MKRSGIFIGVIAAAIISACGGGGSGGGLSTGPSNPGGTGGNPNTPATTNVVTLSQDASFQPGAIAVAVGTTVTWKWAACTDGGYGGYGTCASHSVAFDDGSNITSPMQTEGTFTRTFASAGTFKYHCVVHGSGMSGQVTVQ